MEVKKVNKDQQKIHGLFGWFLVLLMGGLITVAGVITALKHFDLFHSNDHANKHPTNISQRYVNTLQIALQFFDVQKWELVNNRIAWRGDSGLEDGREQNLDLTKGMYDAGDLIKFGFPMAFTTTVLSWAILEYGDRIEAANQMAYAQGSLRWITDYLINSHPSANVLYVQVGDPETDHGCWMRPEDMTEKRLLTQVNTSFPGSDVAAETAAAMASASLVFKKSDALYSKSLLTHARQLFDFADTYRASYSSSLPQVQKYYNSSDYGDELLWAAAWLYHATREKRYLEYATRMNGKAFGDWGSTTSWFSWDDKHAGAQVLLSRINFLGENEVPEVENLDLQLYRRTADMIMCGLIPESPIAISNRTKSGLIWVREWNPLQYAVSSAFLAILYSDYMLTSHTETLYCNGGSYGPEHLRKFAASQVDYVLGGNPLKLSYLVGFGSNYPKYIHHRGSSIPVHANTGCKDGFKWLYAVEPNPNVAVGALVGGPFLNETFDESRNNSMQGEPTTYNSALLVGVLSGLLATSSLPTSLA